MSGDVVQAPRRGDPAATAPTAGEPLDVECPICYQEYNQYNKCPRMLECLHVFCTECLQRIQLCEPPDPHNPPAIPCPLCRHLTPLQSTGALSLPCNSHILGRLPRLSFHPPVPLTLSTRLARVTQRVVFSLEGESRDTRFIIVPTVSLRVQQMHPDAPYGAAPGLVGEEEVIEQSKKTLLCVQMLAIVFWVLFVITCVVGLVFGPHFLNWRL